MLHLSRELEWPNSMFAYDHLFEYPTSVVNTVNSVRSANVLPEHTSRQVGVRLAANQGYPMSLPLVDEWPLPMYQVSAQLFSRFFFFIH